MHGTRFRALVAMAVVIAFVSAMFAGTSGIRAEDAPTETATPTEVVTETPTPEEPTEIPTIEPTETLVPEVPTEIATTEPAETATVTEIATPTVTATATFSPASVNACSGLSSVVTTDLATWDLS